MNNESYTVLPEVLLEVETSVGVEKRRMAYIEVGRSWEPVRRVPELRANERAEYDIAGRIFIIQVLEGF